MWESEQTQRRSAAFNPPIQLLSPHPEQKVASRLTSRLFIITGSNTTHGSDSSISNHCVCGHACRRFLFQVPQPLYLGQRGVFFQREESFVQRGGFKDRSKSAPLGCNVEDYSHQYMQKNLSTRRRNSLRKPVVYKHGCRGCAVNCNTGGNSSTF